MTEPKIVYGKAHLPAGFSIAADEPHTLFSNGTEGEVWQEVWCNVCANDHAYHEHGASNEGCKVWLRALDTNASSAVPEFLPTDVEGDVRARWYCTSFTPCHKGGCEGDDQAKGRARLHAHVVRP